MHEPVLLKEITEGLSVSPGETVLDCTVNRAGHGVTLATQAGAKGTYIGLDLDRTALEEAKEKLFAIPKAVRPKIHLCQENFRNIENLLETLHIDGADKILFDLGISSEELEVSGRGFSFMRDEPLLMTLNSAPAEDSVTAADIVNVWQEKTLADIIWGYGGERNARRIAKAIVEARALKPIKTSMELAEIVKKASPKFGYSKIHPATKTFQAIRIAVNDELGAETEGLKAAATLLRPKGRIAVISFHELEDRIAKRYFQELCREGDFELLTKKPIVPGREETKNNPRARSAKLRIIKRIN